MRKNPAEDWAFKTKDDHEEIPQKKILVLDRYGRCPNCNEDWDGGDILQQVSKMDVFLGNNKEAKKFAEKYGWTEQNKKRFSAVINIIFSNTQEKRRELIQCPDCLHVFDVNTKQEFVSLNEARNNLYE